MGTVDRIKLAYNNVYVVRHAKDVVLIDTGPDYSGAREKLAKTAPSAPDLVVATHGHLDHAGLGAHWGSRGIPVAIGPADALLTEASALDRQDQFEDMIQFVRASGAPAEVAAEAEGGLTQRRAWARQAAIAETYPPAGRGSRWPTGLRFEPFTASRALGDGERVGAQLRVVACPGHTPGNLVLVQESDGWLFSGDQLLPEVMPTPGIQHVPSREPALEAWRFRSLPAFVASLRRLREYDFARCFPGHGDPFDNVREVIDANLSQLDERTERVAALLRSRGSAAVYTLADDLYPRALRRRFWQIIATVQGHLDLLEDIERARLTDGRYVATSAT